MGISYVLVLTAALGQMCTLTHHVDMVGNDLLGPTGRCDPRPCDFPELCCKMCSEHNSSHAPKGRCAAWSWNNRSKTCWLKSRQSAHPHSSASDTSGVVDPVIPIYEMVEIPLPPVTSGNSEVATPDVTVRGPPGSRRPNVNVLAFYRGKTLGWVFRLAPDAVGSWKWVAPAFGVAAGTINCVAGPSQGGIIRDPRHPGRLAHEDGSPHMLFGIEVDWLWALGLDDGAIAGDPTVDQITADLAASGFNHVLVSLFANYSAWNSGLPPNTPPRVSPAAVTPWVSGKEYELNQAFFDHWDLVLRTMAAHNLTAHIMLYVGNKGVVWPTRNSAADDAFWAHAIARFNAVPNVVLDVSKEAGAYGIGVPWVSLLPPNPRSNP